MPPCHIRNVKLVAEADLPILPFLAPRVFQPWPFARQPSRNYCDTARRASSSCVRSSPRRPSQTVVCEASLEATSSTCQPWRHQTRHNSTRADTPAPATRDETRSVKHKTHASRSQNAKDWYNNALAGLEVQLADQQNGGSAVTEKLGPDGYGHASSVKDTHPSLPATSKSRRLSAMEKARQAQRDNAVRRAQRSRAWDKARNTTSTTNRSHPLRIKWVQAGHPVRLRKKPVPTSPETSPQHELGYAIPENVYRWNACFAKLQKKYDKSSQSQKRAASDLLLHPKAAEYARHILDEPPSTSDVPQLEVRFGLRWHEIWFHSVLHLLKTSPTDAARFLVLTHIEPYPPPSWINDCLQYLASHFTRSEVLATKDVSDQLLDTLCTLMTRPGPRPKLLKGSAIRLLLPRCTKDQILRIFDNITRNSIRVHWNTLLHLATYLAKHDNFDQALDALLDAASSGADPTSSQFESTCATILRKAATQSDGLRVSLRIIQNLSALGVKLNIQHCNIVMLNAVESGDLPSAFNVYHSLIENGLQADQYTHAILLKGCKTAIEDSDTLNATIREAIRNTEVLKSPVVATEILHCLYLHHFHRNPDTAFATVAEAYTQLFDATSLIRMHMLPADSQGDSDPQRKRPTLAAIGIMVSAFLRDRAARHSMHSARQQYNLYKHMRMLVERGFQPWASLAETDYIANAFLMAFTSHPSSLAYAAEVIRDMQTPLPPAPESLNSAYHVEREPCKPTVQSWSIFLHGFAKHKKMDLAEQVLQYMRDKGMAPNQVTWNSLVAGYASTRNHDGAVQAFKEMQDQGFKGDEVTFRSLGRLGVDAGMLHQGEEVRGALEARIQRERGELVEDSERVSEVDEGGEEGFGGDDFWDSAEGSLDEEGVNARDDGLVQVNERTAGLHL